MCWLRPVVPGEPRRHLRDAQATGRMLDNIRNDYLMSGALVALATTRAIAKLLSNDPNFQVGNWFTATTGTIFLAMVSYSLLRLKGRT